MVARARIISVGVILLSLAAGVQALYSWSICAVAGSTVNISCKYSNPYHTSVTEREWYRVQSSEGKVLNKDPQCTQWQNCMLTLKDVRLNDSGEYNFRYKIETSAWTYSCRATLTVTDLEVQVQYQYRSPKPLTCYSTCSLTNNPTYIWYKNGQHISNEHRAVLNLRDTIKDAGSYSCTVEGREQLRSPAVCVYGNQKCWSVTYSPSRICALVGSSVEIHSYYTFPSQRKVTKFVWFTETQTGVEPVDLRDDEVYKDRVEYRQNSQNHHSMRINNLRESDAQTYRFRFYTDDSYSKYTDHPGVTLSVTDLEVQVTPWYASSNTLTCYSTCSLTNNPTYIWYKNGQHISNEHRAVLNLRDTIKDAGSYSCTVEGREQLRSPAVCVYDDNCWSVTYSPSPVCALVGSSVEIHSYYTFPSQRKVTKFVWFTETQTGVEPVDLRDDEVYKDRVEYRQNSQNHHSMRINNLRESDAQTYRFRFYTDDPYSKYTDHPGVTLSVTDLEVQVTPWYASSNTLTCYSTCSLTNNPTYIWYKNGQHIRNEDRAVLNLHDTIKAAGSYSCTVEGREQLRSPAVCVYDDNCWSVTYSPSPVCALVGSSVEIHSYYTFPSQRKVTKFVWFTETQTGVEPVDLRDDEVYKDRVEYRQNSQNHHSMRINNLRESDAQTYRFRFYTDDPYSKYTDHPGVTLSVKDLEVQVQYQYISPKTLTCYSTCSLTNNPTYIWYKNGQHISNVDRAVLNLHDTTMGAGSYSCTVEGREQLRSPAVCLYDNQKCWSVTYSPSPVCALVGSSVEIHSYYTFPSQRRVERSVWFTETQTSVEPVDLRDDEVYKDRVEYRQNSQNHHSMRINNLRGSDAQTYRFRFYTDDPNGKYTGQPGVTLSVTGLELTVEAGSDVKGVHLSCSSTCSLSNNPTYIWHMNNYVYDCKSASCFVPADSSAVNYSCAVEGFVSLAVYSPKNTRAVVLPPAQNKEEDFVTLSCSSDANPPVHTYSWFKQTVGEDTWLITDQNYDITNVSIEHSGSYYCTAQNKLGQEKSTLTHLNVLYSPKNTRAVILPSEKILEGDSVTLSCSSDANPPVHNYSWFMQTVAADTLLITEQNYSITNISSQHSGFYYCTAQNELGQQNSTPIHLDVFYTPRNTSVIKFLSTSGDLVTLQCNSDSNPISSYTWYRKTGSGAIPTANGTNITLDVGTAGLYFCMARNQFGSINSEELLITQGNSAVKYVASVCALLLLLACIAPIVWLRSRAAADRSKSEESRSKVPQSTTTDQLHEAERFSSPQCDPVAVYANISNVGLNSELEYSSDIQDDVNYSTVYFKRFHKQDGCLYSTVQLPVGSDQEEDVEYTVVKPVQFRAAPNDETAIYSTVHKT